GSGCTVWATLEREDGCMNDCEAACREHCARENCPYSNSSRCDDIHGVTDGGVDAGSDGGSDGGDSAGDAADEDFTPAGLDLLLVVDNSLGMADEQQMLADSIGRLITALSEDYAADGIHVAVVTTGVLSEGCPDCSEMIRNSCINETGESGRFQDRLGRISWNGSLPEYDFTADPSCRMADQDHLDCLYDETTERGTLIAGASGCGYERGLAAMRMALDDPRNEGFLRPQARLAVLVLSDEEDCGEVGDIYEGVPGAAGKICTYAAKGVGPDGSTVHPNDPTARPYALTPVSYYFDFLLGLKSGRPGLVKFAAVVGADPHDPASTSIEYQGIDPSADITPACQTTTCRSGNCAAYPGTRYIELASLFGLGGDGFAASICQDDFEALMDELADFLAP
ncbi:MAG: hypothetical protein JXR96_20735, partial [Deltaproteobacteria bacterium]|nr:hypothetical protein [Deltaproteobacteria bacterium]